VLYDLGDFIDDYAVDPRLRNDLSLLFLVDSATTDPTAARGRPDHDRASPHARGTRRRRRMDRRRFIRACAELGTAAVQHDDRVLVPTFT
jgi:poly-gamma-glutamate synthesis protein (capsule biosynthesis protein)